MKLDENVQTNKENRVLGLDVPVQSDDNVTGRTGFTEQAFDSYEQRDRLSGDKGGPWDGATDFDPARG